MKSMKYTIFSGVIGFILAIALILTISSVRAQSAKKLGNPWGGGEKAWEQGTVVGAGFLYIQRNENMPPHFQFSFGDRVYVQYEVDGFYFVEKYYDCLEYSIYGWIWHENILLDKDVIYSENK